MSDRAQPQRGDDEKALLRATMRTLRRSIAEREQRSEVLWRFLVGLPAMVVAEQVMIFTSLAGEPDTTTLRVWCAATGRLTAVPEDELEPAWPDVVLVPGLAFTAGGDRLGQGGGWYDRYLTGVRSDCTTIGVCFAEQILDAVPVEPHDVALDHVVTDRGVVR